MRWKSVCQPDHQWLWRVYRLDLTFQHLYQKAYRAFQCEQDKGCVCLVPIVQWYIRSLLACSLRIFVTNLFVHAHSVICSSCSGGDCSFYLCLYPLYGHIQVIRSFGPVLEQILQSCHEAATEFPRMLLPLKICVQVSFIPVPCSSHKLFSAPS